MKHSYIHKGAEIESEIQYYNINEVDCLYCLEFAAEIGYGNKSYYENLYKKQLYKNSFENLLDNDTKNE